MTCARGTLNKAQALVGSTFTDLTKVGFGPAAAKLNTTFSRPAERFLAALAKASGETSC